MFRRVLDRCVWDTRGRLPPDEHDVGGVGDEAVQSKTCRTAHESRSGCECEHAEQAVDVTFEAPRTRTWRPPSLMSAVGCGAHPPSPPDGASLSSGSRPAADAGGWPGFGSQFGRHCVACRQAQRLQVRQSKCGDVGRMSGSPLATALHRVIRRQRRGQGTTICASSPAAPPSPAGHRRLGHSAAGGGGRPQLIGIWPSATSRCSRSRPRSTCRGRLLSFSCRTSGPTPDRAGRRASPGQVMARTCRRGT